MRDGLEFLFSPDIIHNGWLGWKHQVSKELSGSHTTVKLEVSFYFNVSGMVWCSSESFQNLVKLSCLLNSGRFYPGSSLIYLPMKSLTTSLLVWKATLDQEYLSIVHIFLLISSSLYKFVSPSKMGTILDTPCVCGAGHRCQDGVQPLLVHPYPPTPQVLVPEGRLGMSDISPPCLESQGCCLIPLYYLLSCPSAEFCYSFFFLFLSFSAYWPILLTLISARGRLKKKKYIYIAPV